MTTTDSVPRQDTDNSVVVGVSRRTALLAGYGIGSAGLLQACAPDKEPSTGPSVDPVSSVAPRSEKASASPPEAIDEEKYKGLYGPYAEQMIRRDTVAKDPSKWEEYRSTYVILDEIGETGELLNKQDQVSVQNIFVKNITDVLKTGYDNLPLTDEAARAIRKRAALSDEAEALVKAHLLDAQLELLDRIESPGVKSLGPTLERLGPIRDIMEKAASRRAAISSYKRAADDQEAAEAAAPYMLQLSLGEPKTLTDSTFTEDVVVQFGLNIEDNYLEVVEQITGNPPDEGPFGGGTERPVSVHGIRKNDKKQSGHTGFGFAWATNETDPRVAS